jgi:peroxiredoxin
VLSDWRVAEVPVELVVTMRSLPFAIVLALALGASPAPASGPPVTTPPAPPFKVKDLTGRTLELGELLRHGPVLLDFWATWCKPCVEAMPELETWHRDYGPRGLTVIGVSVDGPRNFAKVRPFVAGKGITYPIVLDSDGRLQQLYHVLAVPTAFLIDTTGTIARVRIAYRPGEGESFEAGIRALLPAPAPVQP